MADNDLTALKSEIMDEISLRLSELVKDEVKNALSGLDIGRLAASAINERRRAQGKPDLSL